MVGVPHVRHDVLALGAGVVASGNGAVDFVHRDPSTSVKFGGLMRVRVVEADGVIGAVIMIDQHPKGGRVCLTTHSLSAR